MVRGTGVVKWFNNNKGYGFIQQNTGNDLFVHFRDIEGEGHRSLTEGQHVSFEIGQGQKGPEAQKVKVEE